jgi:hypothetical protein
VSRETEEASGLRGEIISGSFKLSRIVLEEESYGGSSFSFFMTETLADTQAKPEWADSNRSVWRDVVWIASQSSSRTTLLA